MPWTLTDYPVATGQAQPLTPPPGQLVAFDPVPVGQAWRVEGIAVAFPQTPGVALPAPSVAVYDQWPAAGLVPMQVTQCNYYNIPALNALAAGEPTGIYADVDDQNSPLTIRGGGQLCVVSFDTVAIYGFMKVRVQYQLLSGLAGQPVPILGAS